MEALVIQLLVELKLSDIENEVTEGSG